MVESPPVSNRPLRELNPSCFFLIFQAPLSGLCFLPLSAAEILPVEKCQVDPSSLKMIADHIQRSSADFRVVHNLQEFLHNVCVAAFTSESDVAKQVLFVVCSVVVMEMRPVAILCDSVDRFAQCDFAKRTDDPDYDS